MIEQNEIIQKKISEAKKYGVQTLDLSNKGLTEIPKEVFDLIDLRYLSLDTDIESNEEYKNNIRNIPSDICRLKNLVTLKLNNNKVEQLPIELSSLKTLKNIELSNNLLKELQTDIAKLPNLQNLVLKDNPIDNIPPEIIERGIKSILNFFKELEEKDFFYEIKLILVGEGRVGKTSITKSVCNPMNPLTSEQSTEGINIAVWNIPSSELEIKENKYLPQIDRKEFRVNIWDFGGQEIYHSTHQFFLTKRSIYLLVTESRREDRHEDFYYWLNIQRLLGGKSPVVIVLNKCDRPIKEIPFNEYKSTFENVVEFEKVSCHEDFRYTIEALKNQIKKILTNHDLLPHIGTALPKKWVDIRKILENLKQEGRNYIEVNEYYEICKNHYIKPEGADFLSEFLHDIGVFLHFKEDFDLKKTIFLNHEWVTKGVYSVLDNEKVINNSGKFSENDLIDIWKDQIFCDKQRELLSLMKNSKFELCFEIDKGIFLAPQLLPVDEVDYEWRTKNNNLYFEYRYNFMPKGLLTRIIVKRNKDICKNTYWRYGVLLDWENTRALIREKYLEHKLTIVLEGENKKGLLSIIRKTIQEIHNNFTNIQVSEMIPCNCKECRNNEKPHFFFFFYLKRLEQKEIASDRCKNSLETVNVKSLIDDIIINNENKEIGENYQSKDEAKYSISASNVFIENKMEIKNLKS